MKVPPSSSLLIFKRLFFLTIALLAMFYLVSFFITDDEEIQIPPPVFIAHAGGVINHQTYTNSLEALNLNYGKGFRFFEIDFSWTSDGELVAIHDWNNSYENTFYIAAEIKPPTKAKFLQMETKTGFTQLSLDCLVEWLEKKRDIYIITDIKAENIKALHKILRDYKGIASHIIPQVYSYKEYFEAKNLGYTNVILTLYRMKVDPREVMSFAKKNAPFAITMHWKIAESGLAYMLYENNVRVYAHTVNDFNLFISLRKYGVYGIYTDEIAPP